MTNIAIFCIMVAQMIDFFNSIIFFSIYFTKECYPGIFILFVDPNMYLFFLAVVVIMHNNGDFSVLK